MRDYNHIDDFFINSHPHKRLLTATGVFIFSFLVLSVFGGIHLEENHRPLITELSDIELDLSLAHFHSDNSFFREDEGQLNEAPTLFSIKKRLKNLLSENDWDDIFMPIYSKEHTIQISVILKDIDHFSRLINNAKSKNLNLVINLKLINLIDSVIALQNDLNKRFDSQILFLHNLQFIILGILFLYFLVAYRIINKYKNTKKALLLKQRAYLKLIKETNFFMQKSQKIAQLGYYSFNFDERRMEVSSDFSELLGLETSIISYNQWLKLVIEEDRHILISAFKQRLHNSYDAVNIFYRIKRPKDGQIRWIYHFANNVDIDYKFLPVFGILQDITEKRQLERNYINAFIEAQEQEKHNFGEELHDGISQILAAESMFIQVLIKNNQDRLDGKAKHLLKVKELNLNAINDTRRIAHGLMSKQLKEKGLLKAIQHICDDFKHSKSILFINTIKGLEEPEISKAVKINIYRVFQEITTNIARHSGATKVEVSLVKTSKNELELVVEDNGVGIDFDKMKRENRGSGLKNIERRITLLNGKVVIDSVIDKGTKFTIIVPLEGFI